MIIWYGKLLEWSCRVGEWPCLRYRDYRIRVNIKNDDEAIKFIHDIGYEPIKYSLT
jgi:hypothetical protein